MVLVARWRLPWRRLAVQPLRRRGLPLKQGLLVVARLPCCLCTVLLLMAPRGAHVLLVLLPWKCWLLADAAWRVRPLLQLLGCKAEVAAGSRRPAAVHKPGRAVPMVQGPR